MWNEQLKREVPFDWQITGIKEITNIAWGQCPDGKNILDKTAQGNNVLDYCSGAGDMKGGFLVDCQAKTDNSTITYRIAVLFLADIEKTALV